MNVYNLTKRLQELAESSTDAFELMVLAKAIEKAKVGAVRTVATFGDLPTLPLAEDGELFLVEADEDIYFNVGSTWDRFRPFPPLYAMGWGNNNYGQLGDGTTIWRSSPVTVVGGITDWTKIANGNNHNLGLTRSGALYTWGINYGALGDGTSLTKKSSPVTVIGGITGWSAVGAGNFHSLAVANGIAYSWGANDNGQLGDDTTVRRSSPVTVVGGITNWSEVDGGAAHSLGLTDTGVIYAWGKGNKGQLGEDTIIDKSSPVTVVGGITNWSAISAGGYHSLGITDTGILYTWGYNFSGQLGIGNQIDKSSPVTILGGITNWSAVAAGSTHSLGVANGIAYAWGSNAQGHLGDNSTIRRSSPVTVVGGITNWNGVAGNNGSLGISDTGIAYGWGSNFSGQLGDGTNITKSSPVTVIGGITTWSEISAGGDHSLALKS